MLLLDGSRTNECLKIALSDEARFDRLYLSYQQTAESAGRYDLAAKLRAAARDGASRANRHLDYLVAGDDPTSINPAELDGAIAAIANERAAMYAGMARTARDEGFEEIGDWFETLAKSGRSRRLSKNT
jgi:rubrerythrin